MGYMDVKTSSGVYFYVLTDSSYSTTGSAIPYQNAILNIGGAMNLATGVFTAPVSGRYFFSFKSHAGIDSTSVALRYNGGGTLFAHSEGHFQYDNMLMSGIQNMRKGDQIISSLLSGSLYSNSNYATEFSGILLEEDLVI